MATATRLDGRVAMTKMKGNGFAGVLPEFYNVDLDEMWELENRAGERYRVQVRLIVSAERRRSSAEAAVWSPRYQEWGAIAQLPVAGIQTPTPMVPGLGDRMTSTDVVATVALVVISAIILGGFLLAGDGQPLFRTLMTVVIAFWCWWAGMRLAHPEILVPEDPQTFADVHALLRLASLTLFGEAVEEIDVTRGGRR
jgi:hypothetical protein